jgi:hypothetical protein
MGQAKKRGTYEERVVQGQARQEALHIQRREAAERRAAMPKPVVTRVPAGRTGMRRPSPALAIMIAGVMAAGLQGGPHRE